jgi:hypothetical protein
VAPKGNGIETISLGESQKTQFKQIYSRYVMCWYLDGITRRDDLYMTNPTHYVAQCHPWNTKLIIEQFHVLGTKKDWMVYIDPNSVNFLLLLNPHINTRTLPVLIFNKEKSSSHTPATDIKKMGISVPRWYKRSSMQRNK